MEIKYSVKKLLLTLGDKDATVLHVMVAVQPQHALDHVLDGA